jgi:hypothetical protein
VLAICVIDLEVHAVGVEQEDTMSAILAAVVEVDRMRAVEVGSRRGAIGVEVPNGASVIGGV